jgi:hypothetical protein
MKLLQLHPLLPCYQTTGFHSLRVKWGLVRSNFWHLFVLSERKQVESSRVRLALVTDA